ncbi:hypothetical protein HK098_008047 [Nowakowskiella sp. JEL0407]|nr:hypothetical protein HK098_008047 [Nowakowskiella sp. JEL0407]
MFLTCLMAEDTILTAPEFLEQEEQKRKEAKDALPGKTDKCSFNNGYILQNVYACLDCSTDSPMGVCYACFVISGKFPPYFPRSTVPEFLSDRCDCGTSRCKEKCSLQPKFEENENSYNNNFVGKYCFCGLGYDHDSEEDITMLQCLMCQDWFHDTCLKTAPEVDDDSDTAPFDDFICRKCVSKHGLHEYRSLDMQRQEGSMLFVQVPSDMSNANVELPDSVNLNNKRPIETGMDSESISAKIPKVESGSGQNQCLLESNDKQPVLVNVEYDVFCSGEWRTLLCRCEKCLKKYKTNKIEYLLSVEFPYEPDEDQDADKPISELAFSKLPLINREIATNGVEAYKQLEAELKEYLGEFVRQDKVVTKEDIERFFEKFATVPFAPQDPMFYPPPIYYTVDPYFFHERDPNSTSSVFACEAGSQQQVEFLVNKNFYLVEQCGYKDKYIRKLHHQQKHTRNSKGQSGLGLKAKNLSPDSVTNSAPRVIPEAEIPPASANKDLNATELVLLDAKGLENPPVKDSELAADINPTDATISEILSAKSTTESATEQPETVLKTLNANLNMYKPSQK